MVRVWTRLFGDVGLLLALATTARSQEAQNGQYPVATQSWRYQSGSCEAGLTPGTPGDSNGTLADSYGATWQVNCHQRNLRPDLGPVGTNGRGISACFRGCDKLPGCVGFSYYGTVAGATAGFGHCFYQRRNLVNYVFDNSSTSGSNAFYAGAHMVRASPALPCPYYNNTQMQDNQGNTWGVYCGWGGTGTDITSQRVDNMHECYAICNANPSCTQFTFNYGGSEPNSITGSTLGTCSLKSGSFSGGPVTYAQPGSDTDNFAYRVNSPALTVSLIRTTTTTTSTSISTPTSTSTIASSSSSSAAPGGGNPGAGGTRTSSASSSTGSTGTSAASSAAFTGVCTTAGAVQPTAPACPGANNTQFTSPCRSVYTVYCGYDNDPGSVSSTTASSLSACMASCDAYQGCQSASLQGTTCWIKTAFTALKSQTGLAVIVRTIPPNQNYAAPYPGGTGNASTGCGSALPAGLTPDGPAQSGSFTGPDGLTRSYLIHIPKYYDTNKASPLMFGFHGNGATASTVQAQLKWDDPVLNPYGIAVYVTGMNRGFISNPDWGPTGSNYPNLDDVGFMKNFVPFLTSSFCVDTGRIFAAGQSNGGGFVQVLACDPYMSSVISVYAGSSAAMYTNQTSGDPWTVEPVNTPTQALCSPARNDVAIVEIHGLTDATIPYAGSPQLRRRVVPAIPHWATRWAERQGYSGINETTIISTGSNGVTRYRWGNADNLGIITQYTLNNCGHCFADSRNGLSAAQTFMDFFYAQTSRWGTGPVHVTASSSVFTSASTSSSSSSSTSTLPPTSISSSSSSSSTDSVSPGVSTSASTTSRSSLGSAFSTALTSSSASSTLTSSTLSSISTTSNSSGISSSTTSTSVTMTSSSSSSSSPSSSPSSSYSSTTSLSPSSSSSSSSSSPSASVSSSAAPTPALAVTTTTITTASSTNTRTTTKSTTTTSSSSSSATTPSGTASSTPSASSRTVVPTSSSTGTFSSASSTGVAGSATVSSSAAAVTWAPPPSADPSTSSASTGATATTASHTYTPPPACPTGTVEEVCGSRAVQDGSVCDTGSAETALNITCGFASVGQEISDEEAQDFLPPPWNTQPYTPPTARASPERRVERRGVAVAGRSLDLSLAGTWKRVLLPDTETCTQACMRTPGCVGANYVDYNCTLLSSITGTTAMPGAVTLQQLPFPEPPPGYVPPETSTSTTGSSRFAGLPTTGTADTTGGTATTRTTSIMWTNSTTTISRSSTPSGSAFSTSWSGGASNSSAVSSAWSSLSSADTRAASGATASASPAASGISISSTSRRSFSLPGIVTPASSSSTARVSLAPSHSVSGGTGGSAVGPAPIYGNSSRSTGSASAWTAPPNSVPVGSNTAGSVPAGSRTSRGSVVGPASTSGATVPPSSSGAVALPGASSSVGAAANPAVSDATSGVPGAPTSPPASGSLLPTGGHSGAPAAASTSTTGGGASGSICPGHDDGTYHAPSGGYYDVQCDTAYSGTRWNPAAGLDARQAPPPPPPPPAHADAAASCLAQCDRAPACVAVNVGPSGCTLLTSISGTQPSPGTVALLKTDAPATPRVGTVTVTACRARGTGTTTTTTISTTATVTTCAAGKTHRC